MMKEELGMFEEVKPPLMISDVTYFSFWLIVVIHILVYIIDYIDPLKGNLFLLASILPATGFILVGWMKTYVNRIDTFKGILET